ncbi:MAG: hypothetical protein KIS66_03975 [Fimbriimonadaceae bacterium]|nr:hypothetical protein [Fimbriimonadaceae bacterium]
MVGIGFATVLLLGLGVAQPITMRDLARETRNLIEARFLRPGDYAAWVDGEGKAADAPAFAWDMAVLLSAYAAGLRSDREGAEAGFRRVSERLDRYFVTTPLAKGYAVLPHQEPPERYYDDNAWIALAYLDANEAVPDRKTLARAKEAFAFVMTGESSELGGGVFWRENDRKSKNVCANAPAALAALKLFAATQDAKYRETADRLVAWTKALQDKDGLYFDHKSLAGTVDKTKWSYNTALMIRVHVLRYRLLGEASDRTEALRVGRASRTKWLTADGSIGDEGPFAHHLAEAWLELQDLEPSAGWANVAKRAIEKARVVGRMPDGLYGLRWDRAEVREGRRLLLYQASMLRAAWRAAR